MMYDEERKETSMKKSELILKLKGYGWKLIEETKHHSKWGNGMGVTENVSRSPGEVPKYVAEKILKKARENPA